MARRTGARDPKLEANISSCRAGIGACERRTLPEAGAERHRLQCWDRRVRCEKGLRRQHHLAFSSGMLVPRAEPSAISYRAGIGACPKRMQWPERRASQLPGRCSHGARAGPAGAAALTAFAGGLAWARRGAGQARVAPKASRAGPRPRAGQAPAPGSAPREAPSEWGRVYRRCGRRTLPEALGEHRSG